MKKFLGILLCMASFSVTISHAQNINTPNSKGPMGLEVNTLTGNLFFSRNEFSIPARGFNINIAFSYNSFNFDINNGYGNGWNFLYAIQYKNDTSNSKAIVWGDGREDVYTTAGGIQYTSPRGFFNALSEYQPSKFLLTEPEGTRYYFDNATHKRITKMEEPNGNFISFTYTDTLLTALTNNAGQSIGFSYDPKGRLTSVLDAITTPNRTWSYTYDEGNNLVQATDPLAGTKKFAYIVNGPIKSVTDKNNNLVDIIYYPDFTVSELIGCNKRQSFSYDTATNKSIVTDYLQDGQTQVTEYQYKTDNDASWLVGMKSNCCGYNMSFEYDADGNKIKETDANGNITHYTYDSRGNVLSVTDALNQTISYTYSNQLNKLTSVTDAKGVTSGFSYDLKGNLIQITETGNHIYTASYNSHGEITTSTDPKGNTYIYSHDAYGNPLQVTGPNGYLATLGYDARGNLIAYKDAKGNSSNLSYDILNRVKKITDPISNSIQLEYDAESNIKTFKNQNDESSHFTYDASNRLVQFTDAMGHKYFLSHDAMNNVIKVTNAIGSTMSLSYDSRNRLSKLSDALGNISSLSYDAKGNITLIKLPNGQQYAYTYDPLDRVIQVSDDNGHIAKLVYDKNSNVISYADGTGATIQIEYDSLNRIKKITDPLGNSSSLSYDKNSKIISATDRNSQTSTFIYDNRNRVISATNSNGSVTTVQYDDVGNIISLKDANNNTTTYTYDNLNRLTRTTYPDGSFLEYLYNNKGNVTSTKLTDGSTIQYSYDTLNRVVSKILPDGKIYQYTYDAAGRVKTASNAAGMVTLEYDALNRVLSESYNGRIVRFKYNTAGRTQTTEYPDGEIVVRNFDVRNRITAISKNGNSIVSYLYNNADQLVSQTLANGVTTNYQYDFANRLISINTGNGSIQQTNFIYDKNQSKLAINRLNSPDKSEQFIYDNGNRLINYKRGVIGGPFSVNKTYTYDALGNRTNINQNGNNTGYTANNLNQLTSSSNGSQNISYTYNNNGQLSFDGKFYKSYDAEGRILKDSASPAMVLTYLYDAFGRRVQKKLNGNALNYTFSGLEQIEERDGLNNTINKTIFSNFLRPVENEKNGDKFYFHQNELNSVEAITNEQGKLVEKYEYDAYGKQSITDSLNSPLPGSITGNRFGFTGQVYDSATGIYKFLYREYNPETGVFNQRDPVGYADGMGMYQYVGNNPANGIDVFGLAEDWESIIVPTNEPGKGDPCYHDPKKIKYVTQYETMREKQNLLDHLKKFETTNSTWDNIWSDFAGIGSADSRFYTSLANEQFTHGKGNEPYFFQGKTLLNYEVNYYFTGYAAGTKGYNGTFAQPVSRAWFGSKALMHLDIPHALSAALNPFDTRATVFHTGDLDARADAGMDFGTGLLDAATGSSIMDLLNVALVNRNGNNGDPFENEFDNKKNEFGEWWPVINPETGELGYEFFSVRRISLGRWLAYKDYIKKNCPQNNNGGTRKKPRYRYNPITGKIEVISALDPNEIIGPAGEPTKRWVSVKDRLPYTVTYENDKSATAPAKFVKVVAPIHANMDAASFQLGNFGFNNLTFTIPNNTAAYYQRLDCRDSLGLYVDITAGYDVQNNQVFWELQSIDPVTLLPPSDPLKGLLLLQDSLNPNNGHGFVNFSIKPRSTAQTLDTIGAKADIIFDANEVIPTNVETNTIDAYAPTSHMGILPSNSNNPVTLTWGGVDDLHGCGLKYYTLYVSNDGINFSILRSGITRTDTTFNGAPDKHYYFFILATDSVGNTEVLRPGEITSTYIGATLPVTWLYFTGVTKQKNNILSWATANEKNTREFKVERSFDGSSFSTVGTVAASGNATATHNYQFTDYNIDKLKAGVMYYKLKQVDTDNHFKYSSVIRLTYQETGSRKSIVYPNPTPGTVHITIGDRKLLGSQAILVDQNGRVLLSQKIVSETQAINLGNFPNGIYYIRLSNKEVLKVLKQ